VMIPLSGPSRHPLQIPFDGKCGSSSLMVLCLGCLDGIGRTWQKGTSLTCSPFLPSTRVVLLDRGLSLTILCLQFKVHPRLPAVLN